MRKLRVCVHGVKENLDWHDCHKCRKIAKRLEWEWIPKRKTYIFTPDVIKQIKEQMEGE